MIPNLKNVMNPFAICTSYVLQNFSNIPVINNVHVIDFNSKIDLKKDGLYPAVFVLPTATRVNMSKIEFDYEIAVLTKRIKDVNFTQNINTTSAIVIQFITGLRLGDNDFNIELVNASSRVIADSNFNKLDGFRLNLTLSIPNHINICNDVESNQINYIYITPDNIIISVDNIEYTIDKITEPESEQ